MAKEPEADCSRTCSDAFGRGYIGVGRFEDARRMVVRDREPAPVASQHGVQNVAD